MTIIARKELNELGRKKKALITGVTGMDGAIISRILIDKGFTVYGMIRQSASQNHWRLEDKKLLDDSNFKLVYGDLIDCSGIFKLVQDIKPDWIINLAAMSQVGTSFEIPVATTEMDGMGPIYFLEAIRQFSPNTKFYTACTSEMFGNASKPGDMYNEDSKMEPVSPYGAAKLLSYNMVNIYRDSYNLFACAGILFNHSSYLRGDYFVEKKIGKYIARLNTNDKGILDNNDDNLMLGNLDAYRDIGSADEYMEGIILIMEQEKPANYILATGKSYSIKDILTFAFLRCSDTDILWQDCVKQDPKFMRANELNYLLGDNTRALTELNWRPKKDIKDVMSEIIEYETRKITNIPFRAIIGNKKVLYGTV